MKKSFLFICLFVLGLAVQSCCVTDSCPGVTQVEEAPSDTQNC